MLNKKLTNILTIILISFICYIKLYYIQFDYIARFAPVDDGLFVSNAYSYLNLSGSYNPFVLSKLPALPLFLAVLNKFSISYYLFINTYLILLAIFWFASNKNDLNIYEKFIIITLFIFNPVTMSEDWLVIMREPILALALISLILISQISFKKFTVKFALLFYPILIFTFLLREEMFFLYLFIVFIFLIINKNFSMIFLAKFIIVPSLIFLVTLSILANHNRVSHGSPIINDFIQGEFPNFLNTIIKINAEEDMKINVPITTKKIFLAKENSKTFDQIFKKNPPLGQSTYSCIKHKSCEETSLGYLIWWLKKSPFESGLVDNHIQEQEIFKKMSSELDISCNNGKLSCGVQIFSIQYILKKFIDDFLNIYMALVFFEPFSTENLNHFYTDKFYKKVIINNPLYEDDTIYKSLTPTIYILSFSYGIVFGFMYLFSFFGSIYYSIVKKIKISFYTLNLHSFFLSYIIGLTFFSLIIGPFDMRMFIPLNMILTLFIYRSFKEILKLFLTK